MKVLEEIVAYLSRRGALSPGEIEALVRDGFLPSEDWGQRYEGDAYDYDGTLDGLVPPSVAAPRKGRGRKRRTDLRAPALAARLRGFLRSVEAPVGALGRIADGPTRWDRIAALARTPAPSLAAPLVDAIDAGRSSFRLLWDALAVDGHLAVVTPGERGPAAASYRALVGVREPSELPRHLWLLRRRAIARTHQLLRAQDRLTEAFFLVAKERPELAGKWLSREYHPLAYWAFVLRYNAERLAAGVPWEPRPGERPARRRLLGAKDLGRAWSLAMLAGGGEEVRFLRAFWPAEILGRRVWAAFEYPGKPEHFSEAWVRAAMQAEPKAHHVEYYEALLGALLAASRLETAPAERFLGRFATTRGDPPPAAPAALEGPADRPHVLLFCPAGWN